MLNIEITQNPTTDGESTKVIVRFTDTESGAAVDQALVLGTTDKGELLAHLESHAKAWLSTLSAKMPEDRWVEAANLKDTVGEVMRIEP